jgi:hypothetical protein
MVYSWPQAKSAILCMKRIKAKMDRDVARVVERLPSKPEALRSNSSTAPLKKRRKKPGTAMFVCIFPQKGSLGYSKTSSALE